jgi:hypothetical protein
MFTADLLISVGIWVSGVGMSAVGIEMTINTPNDKTKWFYRGTFIVLGVAFIGLGVLQFDRADQEGKTQAQKSTIKKDTLTLCSEMDQWLKDRLKSAPPPTIAIPGKATQAENDAQNAYWLRMQSDYYTRFASRALALLQQYGAKGVDVRALEQQASNGFMPQNIILEAQSICKPCG